MIPQIALLLFVFRVLWMWSPLLTVWSTLWRVRGGISLRKVCSRSQRKRRSLRTTTSRSTLTQMNRPCWDTTTRWSVTAHTVTTSQTPPAPRPPRWAPRKLKSPTQASRAPPPCRWRAVAEVTGLKCSLSRDRPSPKSNSRTTSKTMHWIQATNPSVPGRWILQRRKTLAVRLAALRRSHHPSSSSQNPLKRNHSLQTPGSTIFSLENPENALAFIFHVHLCRSPLGGCFRFVLGFVPLLEIAHIYVINITTVSQGLVILTRQVKYYWRAKGGRIFSRSLGTVWRFALGTPLLFIR